MKLIKLLCLFIFTLYINSSFAEETSLDDEAEQKNIFFPIVFYTPETSVGAGGVWVRNLWEESPGRNASVFTNIFLTQKSQQLISISPKLYFLKGTHELTGNFKSSIFPSKFFGRNSLNTHEKGEVYSEKDLSTSIGVGHQLYQNIYLRAGFGLQNKAYDLFNKNEPNDYLNSEFLQSPKKYKTQLLNLSFDLDERDNLQSPANGKWHRFITTHYKVIDDDNIFKDQQFLKLELDLRNYYSWTSSSVHSRFSQHIFSSQFLFSQLQGDQIPFAYLLGIGGNSRLRGFYANRYLGKYLALAQIENKSEINKRWTFNQFFSIGKVFTEWVEQKQVPLLVSGGFGFNYYLDFKSKTKLRVDFGFSETKPGVYFIFGDAF